MLLNRSQAAFAQTGRVVWRRRVAGGLAAAGIGAAAAAGVVLGGGPAGAATFEVTTLNSTGDGSLAAAIELANAAPGADTITFAPGLTGTIAMPEGVTITDSVLITGPGADVLSLSGGGTHRVLDISAIGSVTISGLTIADGFTDADFFPGTGAGIRANVGSLALVDDALTNNTVRSPVGGEGGGVYFLGGDLAIAGSTFSGNRAAVDGGAVHVGSNSTTASIAGSTFTGNASPAGRGGALYTVGTILTVDASHVRGQLRLQRRRGDHRREQLADPHPQRPARQYRDRGAERGPGRRPGRRDIPAGRAIRRDLPHHHHRQHRHHRRSGSRR